MSVTSKYKQAQSMLLYICLMLTVLFCVSLSIFVYSYTQETSLKEIDIVSSLFQQTPWSDTALPSNSVSTNTNYSVPAIPSLNLLGPPKCGTRSFLNILSKYDNVAQFGRERSFWNGASGLHYKCYPRMNASQWLQYSNDYDAGIGTLSDLVKIMQSDKKNRLCSVSNYMRHWTEDKRFNLTAKIVDGSKYSGYDNLNCIHPKYALKEFSPLLVDDIRFTLNMTKYCYLIEKGPSQSRVPWVPMIFANLVPQTKIITILRNPVYHVTTAYTAFGRRYDHSPFSNWTTNVAMKRSIIYNIDASKSFSLLNGICKRMNVRWNELNNDGIVGIKRHLELKKTVYKEFIVMYLQRKFVFPQDIAATPRDNIYIWAPFTFPVFLIALFSYDEVLNNKIWNQWTGINAYKVVQFEWLFSDLARSMKVIKCWMMDLNHAQCDKHISDEDNKKIFATKIEKKNHVSGNQHQFNAWYTDNIHRLYNPCYQAMKNILFYDRPKLLLGEWNSWNYTYTD